VRRDVEDILAADAIHHAVVLMHDTMNGVVRMGIESVDFEQHSKVTFVDLDFVPGYLARYEPYRLELWGGLGLIVIDSDQSRKPDRSFRQDRFHELVALVRPARDIMVELERSGEHLDRKQPAEIEELLRERWQDGAAELAGLKAELGARERRIRSLERSLSWRITSPLRSLRQKLPSRRLDR
jgi:hypothetical protein